MSGKVLDLDPFPELGPTFCVLPWLHAMVGTSGTVHPCCSNLRAATDETGAALRAGRASLAEVWNSGFFRELRLALLAGRPGAGCDTCYAAEALGKISYRQGANIQWAKSHSQQLQQLVQESRGEGVVREFPPYLDLRLERTCNLSCRSCSPAWSTFVEREWRGLAEESPGFREFSGSGTAPDGPSPEEQQALLAEVKGQLGKIRRLYLTGGEPLLVRKNQELLESCVREGVAENIELMLNTNLTTFNEAFYGLFPRFKKVQVNCSLDGFGPLNEYLRYPSRWERVDANLRELQRLEGRITLTATFVAQFHNVLHCTSLFEHLESLNTPGDGRKRPIGLDIIHLEHPPWLRYSLLPGALRTEAAARLRRFLARSSLHARDLHARQNLNALESALAAGGPEPSVELLEKNRRYTRYLDRHRGTSLGAVVPELAEFA